MITTLEEIFNTLKEKNYRIIAPVKIENKVFFKEVNSAGEIAIDYLNPVLPVKEWFFPPTEVVMEYANQFRENVEIKGKEPPDTLTAVVGVRPCDAGSLSIIDEVFSWDYKDDFYLKRRQNTLIVTLACNELQEGCFCDDLGIAFDSGEGADILLKDNGDGNFEVSVITNKGKQIFPEEDIKNSPAGDGLVGPANKNKKTLDKKKIKAWLDNNFENNLWEGIAMKCLGCGVCTFVCPTCHCFDIVDEASYIEGVRRKNWDSCSFGNFTLHTSGHNPRPSQKERFRNRIMHKFKYYEDKFDKTACVGCGRCGRNCPVNMSLKNILEEILSREQACLFR